MHSSLSRDSDRGSDSPTEPKAMYKCNGEDPREVVARRHGSLTYTRRMWKVGWDSPTTTTTGELSSDNIVKEMNRSAEK